MEISATYRLRDGLSFCWVEGQPIFLDTLNDRYFRLPNGLEQKFVAVAQNDAFERADVVDLLRCGLLSKAQGDGHPLSAAPIRRPSRSAIEQTRSRHRVRRRAFLEVFATVCSARLQLRWRRLKDVLEALEDYRERRASAAGSIQSSEQKLSQFAGEFRRARLYVPIETSCLLDSLALVRYLARHNLRANIVFGVVRDPFSAHCWVQAGELVLSDTVGNANAHTPIRMI